MVTRVILIAVAGALGTLSRYALFGLVQRVVGISFPWSTLVTNAFGCFVFGLVWSLSEQRLLISDESRIVLLTGFVAAFTTFSTFAGETIGLLETGRISYAVANIFGQNVLGLLCCWFGALAARFH